MPKITPEDMDKIRDTIDGPLGNGAGAMLRGDDRDTALALILISIYDRGYEQGQTDAADHVRYNTGQCPFTAFVHTRFWCGYAGCRES